MSALTGDPSPRGTTSAVIVWTSWERSGVGPSPIVAMCLLAGAIMASFNVLTSLPSVEAQHIVFLCRRLDTAADFLFKRYNCCNGIGHG